MERALTLFSLEMDICRFVLRGGYDQVDWRRVDFYLCSICFFIYLFICFCLNRPPFLSPFLLPPRQKALCWPRPGI